MTAQTERAIEAARATVARLPEGVAGDDDRIAVGETVAFVAAATGFVPAGWALLDDMARQSTSHVARGALYFHRGRQVMEAEAVAFLRLAPGEFTRAGHHRGRAVTLAAMCWPTKASGSPEHRLRLGRRALELAQTLDDPWAVAYCAGRLAGAETYLGDREGLEHYALAPRVLVADPDPQAAAVASLNQVNGGLAAFGYGDYADARRILGEGRALALGEEWLHWFDGAIALVDWRTGALGPEAVPVATVVDGWGPLGGSTHQEIPDQLRGVVTGALTRREHEIAVLAAKGLTAAEIATELSISVWTARHHLQAVRNKLGGVPKRKLGRLSAEPDSWL